MNPMTRAAMLAAILFTKSMKQPDIVDMLESYYNRESQAKNAKKCLLKDCIELTTHNGGYCCAEHCRMDRKNK